MIKRTFIISMVVTDYANLEAVEEGLLDCCDNIANSYPGCSLNAEICVNPLSDTLISDLCNTDAPR